MRKWGVVSIALAAALAGCSPEASAPAYNDADAASDNAADSGPPLPPDASAIVRWFRQDQAEADRRARGRRTSFNGTLRRIDRSFPGLVILDLTTGDNPEHLSVVIAGDGIEQTGAMRVGRLAGATCGRFDVAGDNVVATDCLAAGAEEDR